MRWEASAIIAVILAGMIFASQQVQPSVKHVAGVGAEKSAPTPVATPQVTPSPSPSPSESTEACWLPTGEPERITVEDPNGKVLIDTGIVREGLDNKGEFAGPFGTASLYSQGDYWANQLPGLPGPSIIGAHISRSGEPDVFYRLPKIDEGDLITVFYSSGDEVPFVATKSLAVDKNDAVNTELEIARDIWLPSGDDSVIRLLTCDPSTPVVDGHYLGNWVVFGVRADCQPAQNNDT